MSWLAEQRWRAASIALQTRRRNCAAKNGRGEPSGEPMREKGCVMSERAGIVSGTGQTPAGDRCRNVCGCVERGRGGDLMPLGRVGKEGKGGWGSGGRQSRLRWRAGNTRPRGDKSHGGTRGECERTFETAHRRCGTQGCKECESRSRQSRLCWRADNTMGDDAQCRARVGNVSECGKVEGRGRQSRPRWRAGNTRSKGDKSHDWVRGECERTCERAHRRCGTQWREECESRSRQGRPRWRADKTMRDDAQSRARVRNESESGREEGRKKARDRVGGGDGERVSGRGEWRCGAAVCCGGTTSPCGGGMPGVPAWGLDDVGDQYDDSGYKLAPHHMVERPRDTPSVGKSCRTKAKRSVSSLR